MDTLAGNLEFKDVNINIVKEDKDYKIVWNESLILPSMNKDDKIQVEVEIAISMIIEDLNGRSSGSYVVPKVKTIIENYIKN